MVDRCLVERTCLHCNNSVSGMREYCSNECKKERKKILRKFPSDPICVVCSSSFKRIGNRQKCCSPECTAKKDELYSHKYKVVRAEQVMESSRASMRKQRLADPERFRQRDREWRSKNFEELNARRRTPEYREKAASRLRRLNAVDPAYRAHNRMASAVYQSLKGRKNGRKWEILVGYTCADLVRHLERQFVTGMSWDNMGDWHIDHIVPKSTFHYTDASDPEFKACWALTNLRPLWSEANQKKHATREFLL